MSGVQIEIRIIHPTEGEIVNRYDASTIRDDMGSLGVNMQVAGAEALSIPAFLRGVLCAVKCESKAGFAACVARCMLDGSVCDGGVDNCD